MKKFNKLFNTETTCVKINTDWYKVKAIHETRNWIEVKGLVGNLQRDHIEKFTNKYTPYYRGSVKEV